MTPFSSNGGKYHWKCYLDSITFTMKQKIVVDLITSKTSNMKKLLDEAIALLVGGTMLANGTKRQDEIAVPNEFHDQPCCPIAEADGKDKKKIKMQAKQKPPSTTTTGMPARLPEK
jgi:hypothetical protein